MLWSRARRTWLCIRLHDFNCFPELKPETNGLTVAWQRLRPRPLQAAHNGRSNANLFARIYTADDHWWAPISCFGETSLLDDTLQKKIFCNGPNYWRPRFNFRQGLTFFPRTWGAPSLLSNGYLSAIHQHQMSKWRMNRGVNVTLIHDCRSQIFLIIHSCKFKAYKLLIISAVLTLFLIWIMQPEEAAIYVASRTLHFV
jgi:hypothetical protein